MATKCLNKNTLFYKTIAKQYNENQISQITDKLDQEGFKSWYGEGDRDSFSNPTLVDNTYLVNDKGQKMTLNDLLNDKSYEKRQYYKKDLTFYDKIENFLGEARIGLVSRINQYKNTDYANSLKDLLDSLDLLNDNDYASALTTHSKYILKTIEDFENRLSSHDRIISSNLSKKEKEDKNKSFKNFLIHSTNFLETFSKIKDLETPKVEGLEVKEIISRLKEIEGRATELQNRIKEEVENQVRDILKSVISNPEVRSGAIDFLAAQIDESKTQYLLDALGDSHNTFLGGIDKYIKLNMEDKKDEYKKVLNKWKYIVENHGSQFKAFNERIVDKTTGQFIQKYQPEFYDKLQDFNEKLNNLKLQGKEKSQEYSNILNEYFEFKRNNQEQKYIKEYYEALNLLTPEAREAKSSIDTQKSEILSKKELKEEDYKSLRNLDDEMKWLKSSVTRGGIKKTGKDLEIAESLFNYSKELNKFYHTIGISKNLYEISKQEANEKGKLVDFLRNNTTEQFSQEFWDRFKDITSKVKKSEDIESIDNEIKQLLIGYKNSKGEIRIHEVPKSIKEQVLKLEEDKKLLKTEINKSVNIRTRKEIAKAFSDLVEIVPTSVYKDVLRDKTDDLLKEKITKEEYNKWYEENHITNPYSQEITPISFWTTMRPRNKKYIEHLPNKRWQTTDVKPEFLNPKFEQDNQGYSIPTNKWLNSIYQNLSQQDKEGLKEIESLLMELVEHNKKNRIRKGYLPSIPLKITRKNKEEQTEKIVNEADEIVRFIPFKYMKQLVKEELPQVQKGMSDKQITDIEEKRAKLYKENKLYHAENINYNLDEIMPAFIDASLTNKYKTEIEVDIKLFSEMMKQMKVKQTNAKEETYGNKIRSLGLGKKVEHEVSAIGSNMQKHFEQYLSIFYEDFELDEGNLTKLVDFMQPITSLTSLGLNVTSALNNKVVGNIMARMESAGGRNFTYKDYREARMLYFRNITGFIADHNKDKASNYLTAFIRDFDVQMSTKELGGKPTNPLQAAIHKLKMAKDIVYFGLHAGEHQIQNTGLIAMAKSHKIIDGKITNFSQFYDSQKREIKNTSNENEALNKEILKDIEFNEQLRQDLRTQFDNATSILEAFDFKDGTIHLKEDLGITNNDIKKFKLKVIGVNQSIHGIYNKEDASVIQRYALGRLATMFRKHLRPMWNKRFGRKFGKTVYNERIEDYESGAYVTFGKFIASPFIKSYKEFQKEEENKAYSAFKAIFKGFKDLVFNSKIAWHTLSEIEKADVKKTAAEMLLLISTIALGFLAKNIRGNDDDDDKLKNKVLTLTLFQCDRLFGELTTFTPIGLVREGNRLFSSPSPIFNTLTNIGKLGGALFMYPFRDEEERKFKTGMYHGQDRLSIYLGGVTPIYNQWQHLYYFNDSFQRYNMFRGK